MRLPFASRVRFFAALALAVPAAMAISVAAQAETTGEEPSMVYILSPSEGEHFPEAPATIDVELSVWSSWVDEGIDEVELYIDGALIATQSCFSGCTFEGIVVEEGEHLIHVDGGADTDSNTIYVGGEPPEMETGEEDTTGGEEDTTGGEEEESGAEDTTGGEEEESGGEGEEESAGGEDEYGEDTGGAANDEMGDPASRGCSANGEVPAPWIALGFACLLLIPAWRRGEG